MSRYCKTLTLITKKWCTWLSVIQITWNALCSVVKNVMDSTTYRHTKKENFLHLNLTMTLQIEPNWEIILALLKNLLNYLCFRWKVQQHILMLQKVKLGIWKHINRYWSNRVIDFTWFCQKLSLCGLGWSSRVPLE